MRNVSFGNDDIIGPQIDITAPESVQVEIRPDGKVLWINVDGVCRLRICQCPNIQILGDP